jgi:SSS family transporter
MSAIDWFVMVATIGSIILYGLRRNLRSADANSYLRGNRDLRWPEVGLAVMATQASAITFLSVPGQAFEDGMRFVQFYIGMPLAMIVICIWFLPRFHRLDVVTAYEFLERRFDVRVRTLGALFFLIQRGLAAGITIFAPSIILASLLGWPLTTTCLVTGAVVIIYTVLGGSAAVNQTQKQQMLVILAGMVAAGFLIARALPEGVSVGEAAELAGATGRMTALDTTFNLNDRYNLWSGLIGGFFLSLSYFGTDQSQVQRYLAGKSTGSARLGLLFNAVLKIPMQFGILFVGILLWAFYVFAPAPLSFNPEVAGRVQDAEVQAGWAEHEAQWRDATAAREQAATAWLDAPDDVQREALRAEFAAADAQVDVVRAEAREFLASALPEVESRDTDYVFLTWVVEQMPVGLVGLLIAVILMAAMSSTAAELSALGATTASDIYRRLSRRDATDAQVLRVSRLLTAAWGLVAIAFALYARMFDNLIEAVNILGSLFYGSVLGIFLCAFFVARVRAAHVLVAALVGEVAVIALFVTSDLGFLWFNLIGCAAVVATATALSFVWPGPKPVTT